VVVQRWFDQWSDLQKDPMKLYLSPLASSMAARIALYGAAASAEAASEFVRNKRLEKNSWAHVTRAGQLSSLLHS
jgi:hypothetical protein